MNSVKQCMEALKSRNFTHELKPPTNDELTQIRNGAFGDSYFEMMAEWGHGEVRPPDMPIYFFDFLSVPRSLSEFPIENLCEFKHWDDLRVFAITIDGSSCAFLIGDGDAVYHVSIDGSYVYRKYETYIEFLHFESKKMIEEDIAFRSEFPDNPFSPPSTA